MSARRLALLVSVVALALPATAAATKPIPDQYIVVLKKGADGPSVAAEHRRNAGARVLDTYSAAIDGYTARLSGSELGKVKADPRVDYVTQDVEGSPLAAQTLPTGINRIDAELSPTALAGNGSGTVPGDVAVFDSGIQPNHPDLNVAGGVDCLNGFTGDDGTWYDAMGHGTHVAGTIGAKDDANGVVGVAPGVRLWSVRDVNHFGSGSASTQLCGIEWVTANGPSLGIKVVNSSQWLLGKADDGNCGYTADDVLHQAICASTAAGITWVFAAGNSTAEFQTLPGPSYDEVLTVTAMADSNGQPNVGSTSKFNCKSVYRSNGSSTHSGVDDNPATFSNWTANPADQAHTIAAPGVCIYSTFIGSTYGNWAGTSMATPHVAGTMQLCLVSGQCSGVPAENIQKIRADAAAYNQANPSFGFKGDPLRPSAGRYYGYLLRAAPY